MYSMSVDCQILPFSVFKNSNVCYFFLQICNLFFLAQAFTDNVTIQEEEIDSYIWVDLQQARKMCSYDNDLRIIEKAETAIHLLRN